MNEATCACKCACLHHPGHDCDGLCEECWLEWCQGSESHAPAVPNSYLDTYGIGNVWTGWIISQAPELVAKTREALLRPEAPRWCPECELPPRQMVRRPGAWKCYCHQQPVVILEEAEFPRAPRIKTLGGCLP